MAAETRHDVLDARLRRHWPVVRHGLATLYPDQADSLAAALRHRIEQHVMARSDELFLRDLVREADPWWFQRPETIGYVCYADLFAGTLPAVGEHLDHLEALGVSYLHLMPLLRAREGRNDGGYAVASYDEVEPRLGTMDDLSQLAARLRGRGMSLCVDLVLNHTAAEHPWAVAARAGDPAFRDFYLFFPDRVMPDRYELTLLEVFPNFAPGNFTWLADDEHWVWSTFHEYQWDLNWANPAVFTAMLDAMLHLADVGVDVLRLDAVPFMWKREGTICQNLPEVHTLLCTLRALMAVASPATVFKAEAIVAPEELTAYLGAGEPERHECDLAYNNQLMVLLWSSLATADAQLLTNALQRLGHVPRHASWVNYVRCHDDIGWAITDVDAASVGWKGPSHRAFLNTFFSGEFPMSFARGLIFQSNPATGDGRVSGSAASLCGIEAALAAGDLEQLDLACRRLELIYAVVYSFGGVPLLYMGDELGLRSDLSYELDISKRDDNRWAHRPRMDWSVAARREAAGSLEERLFAVFASLATDRRSCASLDASTTAIVHDLDDPALFCFERNDEVLGRFTMVANFGHTERRVSLERVSLESPSPEWTVVRATAADIDGGLLRLGPSGYAWLVAT